LILNFLMRKKKYIKIYLLFVLKKNMNYLNSGRNKLIIRKKNIFNLSEEKFLIRRGKKKKKKIN
jgi:hypothetical protein